PAPHVPVQRLRDGAEDELRQRQRAHAPGRPRRGGWLQRGPRRARKRGLGPLAAAARAWPARDLRPEAAVALAAPRGRAAEPGAWGRPPRKVDRAHARTT